MDQTEFTAKVVCEAADIPHGTLNSWILRGDLPFPSQDTTAGKARRFSYVEVVLLACMRELVATGFSANHAKGMLDGPAIVWQIAQEKRLASPPQQSADWLFIAYRGRIGRSQYTGWNSASESSLAAKIKIIKEEADEVPVFHILNVSAVRRVVDARISGVADQSPAASKASGKRRSTRAKAS